MRYQPGSVELWIGLPGSGKSYALTKHVQQILHASPEMPVYSNMPVRGATFFNVDDWIHLPPGFIIIDEIHLLFPARQALRLPGDWLDTLSQTRKRGWHILGTTQAERRVDSVVRDVSLWWYHCTAWGKGGTGNPFMFVETQYPPEDFKKKGKHVGRRYYKFDQRVANSYSTTYTIQGASHLKEKEAA